MRSPESAYNRIISKAACIVSDFKAFIAEQFDSSATHASFERAGLRTKSIALRRKAVRTIEHSPLTKLYSRLCAGMLSASTRVYGTFLLTFGLYIMLVYLVKHFALGEIDKEFADAILSGGIIVSALPLFLVDRPLASLIRSSKMTSYLLTKIFGIRNAMLKPVQKTGSGYIAALILGLLCGSLTIFFSPFNVLFVIIVLILAMLIFASPESGVALLFLLLPFLKSSALIATVGIVLISLSWKVFTLKRTLHFKGVDYMVVTFSALVLLFGLLSSRQPDGIKSASMLLVFTLSYFAVTQLVVNSDIFFSCIRAFLIGNMITSLITILQFFSGVDYIPYTKYIVIDFKPEYSVVMLIAVSLPILLGRLQYASSKTFASIMFFISVAAVILSEPDSYWLTAVVLFFLSLFIISKKGFLVVLFFAVAGVAASDYYISEGLKNNLLEIIITAVTPFKDAVETFGGFGPHLFEGVGFGNISHRFSAVSQDIASEITPHGSFYYILSSGGIISAINYVLILVGIGMSTVDASVGGIDKKIKIMIKVLSCSMIGLLLESLCRNFFSGDTLTLMFFLILGLISAGNNCVGKTDPNDIHAY